MITSMLATNQYPIDPNVPLASLIFEHKDQVDVNFLNRNNFNNNAYQNNFGSNNYKPYPTLFPYTTLFRSQQFC